LNRQKPLANCQLYNNKQQNSLLANKKPRKVVCVKLTDFLSWVTLFVRDVEVGHMLTDFIGEFFWRETHGSDIVCALFELIGRHFHVMEYRIQAIVNVHHRQTRVFSQIAFEITAFEYVMENFYCIVF
jgi:hypothetical protein